MLFNSVAFLFLFLPVVLIGFFTIAAYLGRNAGIAWLIVASLLFYMVWNPAHIWVIGTSLAVNYVAARLLLSKKRAFLKAKALTILWVAVFFNIGFLLSFKLLGAGIWGEGGFLATYSIAIPLAVSFVTFQQIAFLVDIYKGRVQEISLRDYLLYILFFPQLVVGPIVHYREIVPQFKVPSFGVFNGRNIAIGLAIFLVGLTKKVVFADSIAPFVNQGFEMGFDGLSFFDAWAVAIGFQFQIYFDFSGYADMAIGLGRMVGVNLPINFDSPFRAVDRFDVWRRWHVSLGAFMRQYVFFPLCRLRRLRSHSIVALFITVLISAFWHGVGITFVLWGLIQGFLMSFHHLRHKWAAQQKWPKLLAGGLPIGVRIALTFLVTTTVGIMFRSPNLDVAYHVYTGMLGMEGVVWPMRLNALLPTALSLPMADLFLDTRVFIYMCIMAFVIWGMPNTATLFQNHWHALDQRNNAPRAKRAGLFPVAERLRFQLSSRWGLFFAGLAIVVILHLSNPSRFIYYQF